MEVAPGMAVIEGQPYTWGAVEVPLPPNESWFRHRIDLVTVGGNGEFKVVVGTHALWGALTPPCPADRVAIGSVPRPCRAFVCIQRLNPRRTL